MRLWDNFLKFLDKQIDAFGAQYKAFGIFGVINYSSAYFILYYFGTRESSILRLFAVILCLPLIFTKCWPVTLKKYLNLYWFITLLYCLPFFGTYMLLEDHVSLEWLMNIPTGLFLLILLVHWSIFIILLLFGILLGYLAFMASGQDFIMERSFSEIAIAAYLYIYAVIIGLVFSRINERSHQAKIHTMKMLAGSIAHELRTPLSAMMMSGQALGRILPAFQAGYNKAKAANLLEQTVDSDQERYLAGLPQNLQTASQNAHTMITILLTNLNEGTADRKLESCSMTLCVDEALKAYPFSPSERGLVHWRNGEGTQEDAQADFIFLGHKELMKHVLFNLFKNSLYAIASIGKGEIFITVETGENAKGKKINQLIFKDTGPGIPPENLRHIFDRFYTKTEHGTGIGLAFCQSVIQGFGGEITCTSRQGEHTTFTVSFPVK
ncbi:MAG: sensor histidine kinase [Candidatus Paracaedibacter sp.]